MFDADCPVCHRHLLLSPDDITAVHRTTHGLAVGYRCPCGARGVRRFQRAGR